MAKVKINNEEYELLKKYVSDSNDLLERAERCWGENFDNLYYNFITSGFLDKIYEDSISQYYTNVAAGLHVVTNTATGAALGATIGSVVPVIGTAIGAIIGAFIGAVATGIYELCNPRDVKFVTISKEAFENLLENCRYGNDDAYTQMLNIGTKLTSAYVGLYEILAKVNEFNNIYAEINSTAQQMSMKTNVAADGVTLLDIKTNVTINGEQVELSVSEAMNAFYTYTGTVFSSEIEAQYMAETYGLDINYTDLVTNANGFMVETIESGLYTKEFTETILPNYNVTQSEAISSVAEDVGAEVGTVESVVNKSGGILGTVGLYSGLIGATYLGSVLSSIGNQSSQTTTTTTNPSSDYITPVTPTDNGGNGGGNDNTGNPSTTAETTRPSTDNQTTNPSTDGGTTKPDTSNDNDSQNQEQNDQNTTVTPTTTTEEENEAEEQTNSEFIEISDEPLKEQEEIEKPITDFDEQALMEYESQGVEAINAKRLQAIAEANELFDMPDHSLLREKLQGYGYTDAEIEVIMSDREATINAIVNGETKKELASISQRLANEAGVSDYTSSYSSTGGISGLYSDDSRKMLAVASSDPKVADAYALYQDTKEVYSSLVDEANGLIDEANNAKTDLEKIKANIEQISGTDKSRWTSEQKQQYNDAVNRYNEAVTNANNKIDEANDAKTKYEEAQNNYDVTRDYVLSQMLEEQRKSEEENNSETPTSNYTSEVPLEHGNGENDNSVSIDSLNELLNNDSN